DWSSDVCSSDLGFFQVLLPDGTICYTRDGAFKIDAYGRLTTSDGFPIEPEIQIPEEAVEVSISSDGTVAVMYPGVSDPEESDTIMIARFVNPAGLQSVGRNLYRDRKSVV